MVVLLRSGLRRVHRMSDRNSGAHSAENYQPWPLESIHGLAITSESSKRVLTIFRKASCRTRIAA